MCADLDEAGTGLAYVAQSIFAHHFGTDSPLWLRPLSLTRFVSIDNSRRGDSIGDSGRDSRRHDSGRADSIHENILPLAGTQIGFRSVDIITRAHGSYIACHASLPEARAMIGDRLEPYLMRLSCPRPAFAGLSMDRPRLMGIVNVTPDSFSDGGQHASPAQAIAHAHALIEAGAEIIDIGGESTRPGAPPISLEEEGARILPVLRALREENIVLSADTRHTALMALALEAGAHIINDVSGFTGTGSAAVMAAAYKKDARHSFAIAMHMQGTPQTMQENPHYEFAPIDVFETLKAHVDRLHSAGVPLGQIAIDVGFGFGKTPAQNASLIRWTSLFHGLGVPLLLGVSRKSSIPILAKHGGYAPVSSYGESPSDRLGGSLALTLEACRQSTQLIRTHTPAPTAQAIAMMQAMG